MVLWFYGFMSIVDTLRNIDFKTHYLNIVFDDNGQVLSPSFVSENGEYFKNLPTLTFNEDIVCLNFNNESHYFTIQSIKRVSVKPLIVSKA